MFAILWLVRTRTRQPNGVLTGLFFICYAIFRIVVENFREPDATLIAGFTRGQFFSFFLIAIGLAFIIVAKDAVRARFRCEARCEEDPACVLRSESHFRFARIPLLLNAGDDGDDYPRISSRPAVSLFAFEHATLAGKIVLLVLAVGSIFSWSVMVTKMRVIQFARKQNDAFSRRLSAGPTTAASVRTNARFPGSPVFNVYRAGCQELTFQLLGSAEVDETFRARLEIADKISPAQMRAVSAAMERAVGETALKLESQMILLATAVSGAPFLGLLGTVWGVMDTFTGVAEAGSANLAAMAPGVSGALITTVTALCVAIPAMFGYNFLVTSIRGMIVEMDNFAAELGVRVRAQIRRSRRARFRVSPMNRADRTSSFSVRPETST